jgi:two-component system, response regulator YesN
VTGRGKPPRLDPGFDLEAARRRLEHYCRATGLPARLMDTKGAVLLAFDAFGDELPPDDARSLCPACAALGPVAADEERRAQLDAATQADRFGGSYVRLCPHSLIIWASPVISDGVMRAALVGGPAMVVEADEVVEDLAASGVLPPGRAGELRAALDAACRVTPRRAASLGELLADIASAVVGSSALDSRRDRERRRARISEYIHDLKADSASGGAASPYPIDKERELLLAISRGDKPEAQRLLNEILGFIFFSTGSDARAVKARVLELVVLLSRAALEGGADIALIFGLNYEYLEQIARMRSVDDIALWLSGIMVRFTDLVLPLAGVKHADAMQKALKYINARYDREITLEDVARAVKLSPTYFSKLFSEEMGCRFTAYLNRLRVERSKLLLRDTDIPLVDIAGLVGYEDQSYFTKVFRKVAGLSPGKYRESGGRSKSPEPGGRVP